MSVALDVSGAISVDDPFDLLGFSRHFKLDAKKYDSFLKWEARQSLRRKQAVSSTPMSNSNLTADF